jgi:hypothetical protein
MTESTRGPGFTKIRCPTRPSGILTIGGMRTVLPELAAFFHHWDSPTLVLAGMKLPADR